MDAKSRNRGRQLKLVREYRNINKTSLAKLSGVTSYSITRFENGIMDLNDEKLNKIMKCLDWPLEFLDKRTALYILS